MSRRLKDAFARLLGSTFAPPFERRSVPRANRFRPMLEPCEDRTVPTPVVTIAALGDATEGGAAGAFRLTRTETSNNLSVHLSASGTATPWSDYPFPMAATFLDGHATVDVTIAPTNDSASEPTEAVTLTLITGIGYTVGSPASATINLYDNDAQVVTVETVFGAFEGGLDGKIRFTRIGDLSSGLTVNFSTTGSTATSGTDYTSIGTSVNFAANSATAEVSVAAIDDNIHDAGETVNVTVTSGTGYSIGAEDEAELTIRDGVDVTFTLNSYVGAIKYEIPWGSVDPTQATQSLTPTSFNLNIAGQNFAYGSANYTTAPTLLFEYGDLVGVEFALDLTGTGSPFSSISVFNGVATGIDALTQQVFNAPISKTGPAALTLDFSTISIPATGSTKVTLNVRTADDKEVSVEVEIFAGATKTQVRDLFKTALAGKGIIAEASDTTGLKIQGSATSGLARVEAVGFGSGTSPKLVGRTPDSAGSYPVYQP